MVDAPSRSRLPMILGVGTLLIGAAAGGYIAFGRGRSPDEAKRNVLRLAEATVAQARASGGEQRLPATTADWTPRGVACHQPGKRFPPDPAAWAQPPWRELGFTVDGASAYQYRLKRSGAGADERLTVEARGDLDCNGNFTRYAVTVDPELRISALEIGRARD